jgi:IS1 family transposase
MWLELWLSLPANYRQRAVCITDDLACYAAVLPTKRHRNGQKGSGATNCIERFNNTLRQRWPNLVRKTLSFNKDEVLHQTRIRLFIDHYNAEPSV